MQAFLFLTALAAASAVDCRKRTIPDFLCLLTAAAGLISFSPAQFFGVLAALPLLIAALIRPECMGGGDIKLTAAAGFVLGFWRGIWGMALGLLLAVLEKRAGFFMGNLDVFVNAAGGMRADEPSADLAVGMAILSNLLDKVIPEDMLLLGEIGLAGEIRSTPQIQQRVGEGYRLGFRRFLLPRSSMKAMDPADYPEAEFIPVGQLGEAVRLLRN